METKEEKLYLSLGLTMRIDPFVGIIWGSGNTNVSADDTYELPNYYIIPEKKLACRALSLHQIQYDDYNDMFDKLMMQKELFRIEEEARLQKNIVRLGFFWTNDPFMGYCFKSNEQYKRIPKETFETVGPVRQPYDYNRFVIIRNSVEDVWVIKDFKNIHEKCIIKNINDVKNFIQAMKKTQDAL